MRISSIRAGDIVHADRRGRLFHAKVVEIDPAGTLLVEPIERNVSYRHLQASEITAHWARKSGPVASRATSTPRPALELPLSG